MNKTSISEAHVSVLRIVVNGPIDYKIDDYGDTEEEIYESISHTVEAVWWGAANLDIDVEYYDVVDIDGELRKIEEIFNRHLVEMDDEDDSREWDV